MPNSRLSSPIAPIIGFLGLLLPQHVLAQDGDATELAPIKVQADAGKNTSYKTSRTSTATRTSTPVLQIPQAVVTVAPQTLKDKSATNLNDALSDVSGVTQANTLSGANDAIIRRGFGDGGDDSILTDGLNTVMPHSFNATTDSVEVLKGPASTLYGILDPGGVINVITKKPQDQFAADAWSKFSTYGSGKYGKEAGFDVTGRVTGTDFDYRLIMQGEDSDYWRNFGQNKNWLVAPSIKWENDGTEVNLSYTHQQYHIPYDRGSIYDAKTGQFIAIDRRERLDEPWSKLEGQSDLLNASVKQQLGGDWALSLNYAFSRDSSSADQTKVTGYNSAKGIATLRSDVRGYNDITENAFRSDLTGSADLFGLENELLFGAAIRDERTSRSALQQCNAGTLFSVFSPVYDTISPCNYNSATTVQEHEHLQTQSLYGQDRVHLLDGLIAVGGLRLEHYDDNAGSGDTTNTDAHGVALIPNGGLVWQFRPDASLYTNVARTFRPNSAINSAYGNLDPEEGIAYEIGSKVDFNDWLSGTLALYYSDKKNVAYSETVDGEVVYRTAGLVRSKGIELDLAGQLTDDLQMIASYGLTDAVVMDDPGYAGNALANVARNTAALRLAYDYGDVFNGQGSLRFGGAIRAVDRSAGDAANSFYMPGYGLVDLFATYTIQRAHPVEFQLNLNNILDKTYYTSSIGSSAYGVGVGEPFNASLTVKLKF